MSEGGTTGGPLTLTLPFLQESMGGTENTGALSPALTPRAWPLMEEDTPEGSGHAQSLTQVSVGHPNLGAAHFLPSESG